MSKIKTTLSTNITTTTVNKLVLQVSAEFIRSGVKTTITKK